MYYVDRDGLAHSDFDMMRAGRGGEDVVSRSPFNSPNSKERRYLEVASTNGNGVIHRDL